MPALTLTFLGTGTSVGVPMVGCDCTTCTSEDPRDNRLRSSVLVESADGRVLVDCGPDLRQQCLREDIRELDAVLVTHAHADHVTGFDDLRRFTVGADATLPVCALPSCLAALKRMFSYAFDGRNRYPGYFKPEPREIEGALPLIGCEIVPIAVEHGKVDCVGFLFRSGGRPLLGYIPDCKVISPAGMEALRGVECLVIDALRGKPHPTHMSIEEAVEVAAGLSPAQTWLTHIAHEVLHAREEAGLPDGVRIAYDGLKLQIG